MAFCGLFALILGFASGLRFRVGVVLLIEAVAALACLVAIVSGEAALAASALSFVVFSVALQVGYALALMCNIPARRLFGSTALEA